MSTAFQHHASAQESQQPTAINMVRPNAAPWAVAPNDLSLNPLGPDGFPYDFALHYPPQSGALYDCGQDVLPYNGNYDLIYAAPPDASCPRSYVNGFGPGALPVDMPASYPPAAYQIDPPNPHDSLDSFDQTAKGDLVEQGEDCSSYTSTVKYDDPTGFSSPCDSDSTHPPTPGDGSLMCLPAFRVEEMPDKEQPYAQLIYRALMEVPSHTMVLRDIYNWFERNTDKATDTATKGWQNSIRHNLSMNGVGELFALPITSTNRIEAFEKVDQPSEDSKRGFMWRLTEQAIREGVKSTTRYRSKRPIKHTYRPQQVPQRQASGQRGGQAARRSAKTRKNNRVNQTCTSDPYTVARSVPAAIDAAFQSEFAVTYASTPYGCSTGPAADAEHRRDDFGTAWQPTYDVFPPGSYMGTPFPQQAALCDDTARVPLPRDPLEPLFTNSPSPPVDEPLTPDSQGASWENDMTLGIVDVPFVFDAPYREFPA